MIKGNSAVQSYITHQFQMVIDAWGPRDTEQTQELVGQQSWSTSWKGGVCNERQMFFALSDFVLLQLCTSL